MPSFNQLVQRADAAIDLNFAEDVMFTPRQSRNGYTELRPDPVRQAWSGKGVVVGRTRMGGGEFMKRRTEADLLLSIQNSYITQLKQGDIVTLTARGMNCEVSYIEHGINNRSVVHLLRIKDVTMI